MVSSGKSSRYSCPVFGFALMGPVDPKHPPRELTHTTKKRPVSMALPGPIMYSHQPGAGSCCEEQAWAVGESPVNSRIALSLLGASSPQHS
jgi:hypothetical protein